MTKKILIVVAALAVLSGGAVALRVVLGGEAPREVSLDATGDLTVGGEIDFEGTWTVDREFGTFHQEFTSTFAGYRIDEQLAGIGANTAVGRTPNVTGTMIIDGNTIASVSLTMDMGSLRSDQSMRDNMLRTRGLETDTYPTASFELTEPITISSEPVPGEEISAEAVGELTLHGVTREVTVPIEARWAGERITIVSSFGVALDDYDMERPTTARVLSVADEGTAELQLHFTKA